MKIIQVLRHLQHAPQCNLSRYKCDTDIESVCVLVNVHIHIINLSNMLASQDQTKLIDWCLKAHQHIKVTFVQICSGGKGWPARNNA